MQHQRPKRIRRLALALLTIPLLSVGTCASIARDAAINGAFNYAIPTINTLFEAQLDAAWGNAANDTRTN